MDAKNKVANNDCISIITIVLNQKSLIEETIKSVICQKNDLNIEYIIIDGGSKDGTLEIINLYEKNIDYFVSEPDGGIYKAINKGIRIAKYPLVGLIHCGDCYKPGSLSKVYKAFKNTNADIVYCDIEIKEEVDNNFNITTHIANHKYLENKMSIFHPSAFVKLAVYKNIGVYNTEYRSAADYEFFLRLFQQKFVFTHLPFVAATFRSGGISGKNFKLSLNENYQIRYKHLGIYAALVYFYKTIITYSFFSLRKKIITGLIGEKLYFNIKQRRAKNRQ